MDIIENSADEIIIAIDEVLFKRKGNLQNILKEKIKKIPLYSSEAMVSEAFLDSNRFLLND